MNEDNGVEAVIRREIRKKLNEAAQVQTEKNIADGTWITGTNAEESRKGRLKARAKILNMRIVR